MLGCRMSRHEDILDPELPSIFAELSTFIAFGTTLVPLSQIGRRSYVDLSVRAAVRPAFMWGALDCRHVRTPVSYLSGHVWMLEVLQRRSGQEMNSTGFIYDGSYFSFHILYRGGANNILIILPQRHNDALVEPLPKVIIIQTRHRSFEIAVYAPLRRVRVIRQLPRTQALRQPFCYEIIRESCTITRRFIKILSRNKGIQWSAVRDF